MQGLGKPHSTTFDQRIVGHSLVQGLYVLLDRTCALAPQWYRQAKVCEAEQVPFRSKFELMQTLIGEFEPVDGTQTHSLLDSWYCAKCLWHAARERDFLITTGIKSNRWVRVADETAPQGWRWQKLSDYAAQLSESDFVQMRYWASSDLEADRATWLTHIAARWEIEIFFEDGKEELGWDHYQVMSARALLRFWTLAMLVYVFLEEEQQRLRLLWHHPVSIGEARREIQRRHRRYLLEWVHRQFLSGVHA